MRKKRGFDLCSGCGVCLLSCPVWHASRTLSLTRKARAKALQGGAELAEIAQAIDSCVLCGACETACPEGIGLFELNVLQRRELNDTRADFPEWYPHQGQAAVPESGAGLAKRAETFFLPGALLGADRGLCEATLSLFSGKGKACISADDGRDISMHIEAGFRVAENRITQFLSGLKGARRLIVSEGLLHVPLRKWLPGVKISGIGEAVMESAENRRLIGPGDLYIIESRGFHSDRNRLVRFYDALRNETGCLTNLDLQRTAFSTGASSLRARQDIEAAGCVRNARRILDGKAVTRIVVEDLADVEAFRRAADIPVLHVGALKKNGPEGQ